MFRWFGVSEFQGFSVSVTSVPVFQCVSVSVFQCFSVSVFQCFSFLCVLLQLDFFLDYDRYCWIGTAVLSFSVKS